MRRFEPYDRVPLSVFRERQEADRLERERQARKVEEIAAFAQRQREASWAARIKKFGPTGGPPMVNRLLTGEERDQLATQEAAARYVVSSAVEAAREAREESARFPHGVALRAAFLGSGGVRGPVVGWSGFSPACWRAAVVYDPRSGELDWGQAVAQLDYLANPGVSFGAWSDRQGYRCAAVRVVGGGFTVHAHNLAVVLLTGRHPLGIVDHINRVRSDNAATNLREVSAAENRWNCGQLLDARRAGILERRTEEFRAAVGQWGARNAVSV